MPNALGSFPDVSKTLSMAHERLQGPAESRRALILMHGFIHALGAIPIALMFWWADNPAIAGILLVAGLLSGAGELYLSASRNPRANGMARLVVALYALVSLIGLSGTLGYPSRLPLPVAMWITPWAIGAGLPQAYSVAAIVQGLIGLCGLILAVASGPRMLILATPVWLLPWLLAHGLRSVVGAAYYLTCDLGAEPLWRRIENRPRPHVVAATAVGPLVAIVGAMVAWSLLKLGHQCVPPLFYPLLYLVAIDLVLLPLLPALSWLALMFFRRVATRSEAWVMAVSPLFVLTAPIAALILCWLSLHRLIVRMARAVGRWQVGPAPAWLQTALGAIWVHAAVWLLVTCLNAQTGLMLIGRDIPGARLFRQNLRTFLSKLPPEMKTARDLLVTELSRRGVDDQDGDAMRAATVLSGEHPDAGSIRFRDLSRWTQRRLAGLPWYYRPAEFERDRVERCIVFWCCLFLSIMTMIRWPGFHAVLPLTALRGVVCLIRIAAPVVMAGACLTGGTYRPDLIALIAGLVLVAIGAIIALYWLGWLVSRSVSDTRHFAPFIAIRLLQKRRIAFFAVGAVTLCVAMVLIVISVMGGFLDIVRDKSRGLLGDLIMENTSLQGFAGYQQFIDRIKGLRDERGRPIVYDATPVIYTYGVLRFPVSFVTKPVRVVGCQLEGLSRVTRFGGSLNFEKTYPGTTRLDRQQQPCWGWDKQKMAILPPEYEAARTKGLAAMAPDARIDFERLPEMEYPGPGSYADFSDGDLSAAYHGLKDVAADLQILGEEIVELGWPTATRAAATPPLRQAESSPSSTSAPASAPTSIPTFSDRVLKMAARLEELTEKVPEAEPTRSVPDALRKINGQIMDLSDRLKAQDPKAGETITAILKQLAGPTDQLEGLRTKPSYSGKRLYGVVLGRDLIASRQMSGDYERYSFYPRGLEMLVSVLPLTSKGTFTMQQPISLPLRYVDDSRTGVFEIDSICVYVDFTMLQKTMEMGAETLKDGSGFTSPRASQVLIKLFPGQDVLVRRQQLVEEWHKFSMRWPHARDMGMMNLVEFHTWEEQQAQYIGAIENEKVLVTTLFAVISSVAIFLVLCIFYMIVSEKTRDIGTLKSVGATAGGVAGVFLAYGAAIGVVGASLGIWIGTVFVHRINTIQDWIARINPSLRIWSPEVYSFDVIPDTVKFEDALVIFIVAIIASVVGATFPALRAGRTWPVEALRYE